MTAKHRMHRPALWVVKIHGSGRDFAVMWDLTQEHGQPWIHYAGDF